MGFEDYCAQTKTDVKTLTISGENVQQGPHVSDYIKFMGIFGHSLAARLKQFSSRNSKLVDVRICYQRHH